MKMCLSRGQWGLMAWYLKKRNVRINETTALRFCGCCSLVVKVKSLKLCSFKKDTAGVTAGFPFIVISFNFRRTLCKVPKRLNGYLQRWGHVDTQVSDLHVNSTQVAYNVSQNDTWERFCHFAYFIQILVLGCHLTGLRFSPSKTTVT